MGKTISDTFMNKKLENGNEYFGEWKDEKIHGKGTMNYPNGDVYIG